jgi:hypothetical protein
LDRATSIKSILVAALALSVATLSACTQSARLPNQSAPELRKGELYGAAHARLVNAGWQVVEPACGKGFICFGDEAPGLATNLATGENCASYVKSKQRLTVCAKVVPDAAFVESVSLHR